MKHVRKCPVCKRPRKAWPMIFRGDAACSVNCAKALAAKDASR